MTVVTPPMKNNFITTGAHGGMKKLFCKPWKISSHQFPTIGTTNSGPMAWLENRIVYWRHHE
jgi:hypothetical protein